MAVLMLGASLPVAAAGTGKADAETEAVSAESAVTSALEKNEEASPASDKTPAAAYSGKTQVASRQNEAAVREPFVSIAYKVKPGDTFYGIARAYYLNGAQYARIAAYNGLSENGLKAGIGLLLPNPRIIGRYTVQPGDTLYRIAGRFFTKSRYVQDMMDYNEIADPAADVKAGMELSVPLPAGRQTYTVQPDETLYSIAVRHFHLQDYVQAIAEANGVKGPGYALKAGAQLLIPNPYYAADSGPLTVEQTGDAELAIDIDITRNKLLVLSGKRVVKSFAVASGKAKGLTPTGAFRIVKKLKNPYYTPKNITGGDPANPLGRRWLGLNVPETGGSKYGIHGTNAPSSIGKHASAGCIRMLEKDVEWLYDAVPAGTKVIIHA